LTTQLTDRACWLLQIADITHSLQQPAGKKVHRILQPSPFAFLSNYVAFMLTLFFHVHFYSRKGLSTQLFIFLTAEWGQLDGGGVASGGLRELIPCIARACVAVGVDGLFMEVSLPCNSCL
jgi:3-deoxy-D-manno-octulosonic acid (KDO) 8-phosphate synthase